jgi:hydrogenase nickel incorporation protein HypA/HybF
MHELSISRDVVAIVCERAEGQRVTRVRLEIGRLSAVVPDAIRFCFDVCTRGTQAEGAALEIVEVPGRGQCDACLTQVALDAPIGLCPECGAARLQVVAGEELKITEMEVEACAQPAAAATTKA